MHTQNSITMISMLSDNNHNYIFSYNEYEVDYWCQVLLPYTSFINLIKNWFTDRKEISLTIFNDKVMFSVDNGKTNAKLEIHSVKYNTENIVPYVFKISGSSLNRLKTFPKNNTKKEDKMIIMNIIEHNSNVPNGLVFYLENNINIKVFIPIKIDFDGSI